MSNGIIQYIDLTYADAEAAQWETAACMQRGSSWNKTLRPHSCPTYARFPPFRCRSSVAVSPFCRFKIPLFCKNYVRKFRSVRHRDTQQQRQRQRCTETAAANGNGKTAIWKNGNGMVETGHYNVEDETCYNRCDEKQPLLVAPSIGYMCRLKCGRPAVCVYIQAILDAGGSTSRRKPVPRRQLAAAGSVVGRCLLISVRRCSLAYRLASVHRDGAA